MAKRLSSLSKVSSCVANVTSCLVPVQGSNSDDQYHHVLARERDARGAERVSVS